MGHGDKLTLIDIWADMRDEYWAPKKDVIFYRKVSAKMVLRGKIFSSDQCQYMMDQFKTDFKLYCKNRKRSGSSPPEPWDYYEPLRPILEGHVNVEPLQTFAVGVTTETSTNSHLMPASGQAAERVGRSRPAVPASTARRDELKEMLIKISKDKEKTMSDLKEIALLLKK